ncbi:oligopeptide/dipeptide ABC transporter, ATPase subunit [Natrialba hulunbeirensis JCM 10989]|uniref:Oligopeptide/dipeptide ABC transporter, ATPase subunit n=1 Tax=Natrialba hulunbeirensis JCM 10989 TaxID=1227493 RepID=L9ZZK7_9EURY|nr:ABC transporter ATP-binding protein [Natrialba hulunbeirensis]ELY90553.1 oligopeptide/dipeptide ABC transporter, ATPase subunit [Natrialba hulunbeirensis JCM 10989]
MTTTPPTLEYGPDDAATPDDESTDLLAVENLQVQFGTYDGPVRAVDGVSFSVEPGETVGIVGESGCGKSVTARSIVGLQEPGEVVGGTVHIDGVNVHEASDRTRRRLRGDTVSMVFQDPDQTLNPAFDVGEQIAESLKVHDQPERQRLLDYLHAPLFASRSDWRDHRKRAVELMAQVGIDDPADRVDDYPHEFSGGMRQRAGLAIALASDPDLLIADEPTTALDTTTQAQLLDRFRRLTDERNMATLLITHDLGVVADICDRVVVLYAGQVMETGPTDRVLAEPHHPYTRALLECRTSRAARKQRVPTIEGAVPDRLGEQPGCPFAPRCPAAVDTCQEGKPPTFERDDGTVRCREGVVFGESDDDGGPVLEYGCGETQCAREDSSTTSDTATATARSASPPPRPDDDTDPLVSLEGVSKRYQQAGGLLRRLLGTDRCLQAVDDVTLEIAAGETLGLVGESGSGKSTLADLVTGLETPTSGAVRFDGDPVGAAGTRTAATLHDVGVVFQNPRSSLNPRLPVAQVIAEPLYADGWEDQRRRDRVGELLESVGLSERHTERYPHELSGGQLQRVAIARAIALEPRLVVLDEPVSALDVSVQARVLNLLLELQRELELTYLLISHDLDVVEHVSDRVVVLSNGEVVEAGQTERVLAEPSHPETAALVEAVPRLEHSSQ